MKVRRLDLGADVVHIPTRDLLVIHPDLDYTEAIGAVAGTLPDMHPDVVVGLVEKVTARPKRRSLTRRLAPILARMAFAAVATATLLGTVGGVQTASAEARFGTQWQHEMARMGMVCDTQDDGTRICVDARREVTEVRGFRREHASLYMMSRDSRVNFMLIFDAQEWADRYAERHPDVQIAGRVAVW